LVEFAIVAIALYLLLAAILTFGFLLYGAQTIQQAADFAAREISRTPLPAARDFETALDEPEIRSGVYSEDFLAVDMSSFQGDENPNETLVDFAERIGMPPVNRMLLPLMFVDTVDDGAMELLRYPGTLVSSTTASSGYTVMIPVVRYASTQDDDTVPDEQIVGWLPVVEDMQNESITGALPEQDPFHIASPQRGLVALRINYPFQSGVMSGFRRRDHPLADPVIPIAADDSISAPGTPGGRTPVAPDVPEDTMGRNPYSGRYGLGHQAAWAEDVRPFRRVIAAQAIYRREVFTQ
jgi:hypothetical protein